MIVAILTFYYKKICQNRTDPLSCSSDKTGIPSDAATSEGIWVSCV